MLPATTRQSRYLAFHLSCSKRSSTKLDMIINCQSSTTVSSHIQRNQDETKRGKLIVLPEDIWRTAAIKHASRMYEILKPGLLSTNHLCSHSAIHKSHVRDKMILIDSEKENQTSLTNHADSPAFVIGALDPLHPVYNFLIEYYGIKGSGGTRRLARWSPCPSLLVEDIAHPGSESYHNDDRILIIEWDPRKDDYQVMNRGNSTSSNTVSLSSCSTPFATTKDLHPSVIQAVRLHSHEIGGIFLLHAQEEDFGQMLPLKGMIPILNPNWNQKQESPISNDRKQNKLYGVLYHPSFPYLESTLSSYSFTNHENNNNNHTMMKKIRKESPLASYEWYYSILIATKKNDPVLHCHGLHEWAMLYQPQWNNSSESRNVSSLGSPSSFITSSSRFQAHLPLRVSQETIAETILHRGTNCTHFDALRFFTPEALPLNFPSYDQILSQRNYQLKFEQRACVHANMDLFKIALRLQPFLSSTLVADALEVALSARTLDVEASPYDARSYGLGVVPVETNEGRVLYRRRQLELMSQADSVRDRLITAYQTFLELASI